ncbi:MAG: amidohydrolase family protein [Solirubrobacteraceae bacterium]
MTERIIDISVLPFTHEMKATRYEESEALKQGFIASGVWERPYSVAELIAMFDQAGVEVGLLCAHTGGEWSIDYEYVAELVSQAPDRLRGQAGIDPRDIAGGVRRLEQAIRDLGFVGAHSYPHWFGLRPDDRAYYPFYSKCVELEVPVQMQIGKAWQTTLRSVGLPDAVDQVAIDFPELRIVCLHTGYPWERELIAVASKQPNVYIGADSIFPGDWSPDLVAYMCNASPQEVMAGREKVLFGSNYPALSGSPDIPALVETIDGLGLDEATMTHLMGANARRVYRL